MGSSRWRGRDIPDRTHDGKEAETSGSSSSNWRRRETTNQGVFGWHQRQNGSVDNEKYEYKQQLRQRMRELCHQMDKHPPKTRNWIVQDLKMLVDSLESELPQWKLQQ